MKISISKWSKTRKRFVAVALSVATMASAVLGVGYMNTQAAATTQCYLSPGSTNDIVKCGDKTPAGMAERIRQNATGDLDEIFASYNLPASEYNRFATQAKPGKINPNNGEITVDGKPVAYNGKSLGRNKKSTSKQVNIAGKTYWQTPIQDNTKYFNDAMVLFDAKGNVQTIVMNLCGNPFRYDKNDPKYSCDELNMTKSGDNYSFTTKATALNGATVTKVVYEASNGQKITKTSLTDPATFTFANVGSYTVKANVYVKTTHGNGEFAIPVSAACAKTVTVAEKPAPKIDLKKWVMSEGTDKAKVEIGKEFPYIIKVTNTGNVDLKDILVGDKAPDGVVFVKTDKGTILQNSTGGTLSYTQPTLAKGASVTITVTAKLTKYIAGDIKNTACVDTPTIPSEAWDLCDDAYINTDKPEAPKTPGVKIEKFVNTDKKDLVVKVGEEFNYTLKVTNTGEVDLTKVVVTDNQPKNVQFMQVVSGGGSILTNSTATSYTNTLESLKVGATHTIVIKAKLTQYVDGAINNTACVNAPQVNPNEPTKNDDCDDAKVTPKLVKVTVCDPKTGDIISVPEQDKDKYKDPNSVECSKVLVCDESTKSIIEVKYVDRDKYLPENSDVCKDKITVCVVNDWTGEMKAILKEDYEKNPSLYSTNANDCQKVDVCRLEDKTKVYGLVKSEYLEDIAKYSTNMADCQVLSVVTPEQPGKEVPEVLPNTGAGAVVGFSAAVAVVAGTLHRFFLGRKLSRQ